VSEQKSHITKDILKDLKQNTPVDTGLARDSWKIVDGNIVNEQPYIDDLNAGSSKQASAHFVEQTILNRKGVSPNGSIVVPKR
jgi:hypothetical protein